MINPHPRFIAFEGLDGTGKTTQLKRLAEWLRSQGETVVETREPGGTPLGRQLRAILLNSPEPISPQAELLLYAADRAHHVESIIAPALEAGCWVLCDRFTDSTLAYQGYGRGIDPQQIAGVNKVATQGISEPFVVWLRLPAIEALNRLKDTPKDRLESEPLDFYERVADGFEAIARIHSDRVFPVDASASVDEVADAIRGLVRVRPRP
jgi:dTMP kinase